MVEGLGPPGIGQWTIVRDTYSHLHEHMSIIFHGCHDSYSDVCYCYL